MNIIETNFKWNGSLTYSNRPNKIVLHHAEASVCTVQQIHQWHLSNGWTGIGYHFFVRKDGSVYRGRPENCIGAHVSGANTNSLGICAEGSYMTETMPIAQKNAIKELIQYLDNKYGRLLIYGHREVGSSNCPGTNYPLTELKARENIPQPSPSPSPTPSNPVAPVNDWVKRLQAVIGAKQDNIAGSETLSKCPLLKQGNKSDAVGLLQEKLNALGFNCGSVDKIFGQQTANAVKQYQKSKGLSVDGIIGQNTWKKLLGL